MENKFKIFVIVAIAVLALAIAGSTFLVFTVMNNNNVSTEVVAEQQEPQLKSVSLGDAILTNITKESGNVQHYAKIKVTIGVNAADEEAFTELTTAIEEKTASVRSELITTIGEQTYSMLNDVNGKEKLADEIISRLNTLLDTDLVHEVYYEEYFIQ